MAALARVMQQRQRCPAARAIVLGQQADRQTDRQTDRGTLSTPSVWRTTRQHAPARMEAPLSSGMDEIEIPAFLRKQAD